MKHSPPPKGSGSEEESQASDLPVLLVANKQDLIGAGYEPPPMQLPLLSLSAERAGADADLLTELRTWLVDVVLADLATPEATPIVVNQRHRQHFARALDSVRKAREALAVGGRGDTLALDLRVALHELGAITGEITNEDILGTIFSQFCIGK